MLLLGCTSKNSNQSNRLENSVHISHADHFRIQETKKGYHLRVFNPWQDAHDVTYTYILNSALDNSYQLRDSIFIPYPVNSVVCLSTTHVAFLDALNQTKSIAALSGAKFVYNQEVRERVKADEILDIGYEEQLNYERLLALEPDVVFAYGINTQTLGYYQKIQEMEIPVVFIAEYLEVSPLGKAEWLKFVSTFFNKLPEATSIFNDIAESYNSLLPLTRNVESKPVVMTGLPFQGTWYVSGAHTNLAMMIEDAGGIYLWQELTGSSVYPMELENVFVRSDEADIWIHPGTAKSLNDMVDLDERLTSFNAFSNKSVYNNNARLNSSGGNDYFESGVVNPHLILKDLIHIFHPEILPDHRLYYYTMLK